MKPSGPYDMQDYLDHISLDCVIFGYHNNELKVLLLKLKDIDQFALPGGFLRKDETLENAAQRVLKERTGLDQIFLKQFGVFSKPERSKNNPATEVLVALGYEPDQNFLDKRFITVGFLALVESEKVDPNPDDISETCEWIEIDSKVPLILDHCEIIQKAYNSLKIRLSYQPVGYNLLPDKFTMPELQNLYETILGKKLDRRNFQRKMLSYDILIRLNERRKGGPHRSPFLYTFNYENYQKSLEKGFYF